MAKRQNEIVESIITAALAAYGNDVSKYTRASLKAVKPGHGTDMYRAALSKIKLQYSTQSNPVDNAYTSLDKISEIALSIKSYLKQNHDTSELSLLRDENQSLKNEVKSLKLRISELEQQSAKDLAAPKARTRKASGGKGKALSLAAASPQK